nr:hypothetical protein [Tanacetum cinerariifolium]
MNQNFYNSNSYGFEQIQPPQYPVIYHPPQETSVEILQARENLMQSIQTFLRKFNRISFRETPNVLLLDLQIINEELAEYINSLSWNHPAFYNDDDEYSNQYKEYLENSSNAIIPVLPTKDLNTSLSMGDEHLSTILKMESDEVIKSIVEKLVPILSESKFIFDNTRDVPFCDNSPPLDDIDYVEASPIDYELVSLEKVQDDILRKKLLNINLLIPKIKSLDDNSTPNCVLYDHTKEMSTGSITTYADNSLPEYDSFLFKNKSNQGELTSVSMEVILGELRVYVPNILPTHPILLLDSQFIPSDDSIRSDLEVSFPSKTRNKIFDPGIFFEVQSKRFLSRDTFSPTYVSLPFEDRHYLSFTYVI